MIGLVDPNEGVIKIWGKQQIKSGDKYRLMKYVLRVDYGDKVLLHNVVTSQTIVLSQEEVDLINNLPTDYRASMKELVSGYFLVSENYNEYQTVVNLRKILQKLFYNQKSKGITHYTILPTTACNARCYYCFQQGYRSVTMSEKTAKEVIDFIADNCGEEKKIRISWFGGEPTVAHNRIDQICQGLQEKGIQYKSDITTNGYFFDEEMVSRAADYWNVTKAMICVDGTEVNYNKTKAFVNVRDNPYQRVMRNIGLLLEKGIYVNLRMNYDLANYQDFPELIADAKNRFALNPYLQIKVHPVVGEHADHSGKVLHGDNEWFNIMNVQLNDIARSEGYLIDAVTLPGMNIAGCQANNEKSVTITSQGKLVCCPEQIGDDQIIGDVQTGVINKSIVQSWQKIGDYGKCKSCHFFPDCMKLEKCASGDRCQSYLEILSFYQRVIKKTFDESVVL